MSEEAVEGESGGSGKVLLILGLLVGAGIGAGAGIFLSGGDESAATDEEMKVEKEEPKGELLPIDFEKLAVPIYTIRGSNRRFVGNFFIDVKLQVYGQDKQISVKRSEAQLQHAFLSAMSKADLMKDEASSEMDFDKAASILQAEADRILGNDIVANVSIIKSVRMSR